MILSSNEIRKLITDSKVPMIQPFSENQLQGVSYDVSMSGDVVRLKETGGIIDPASEINDTLYEKITVGEEGYLLSPGSFVLVNLTERISLPDNLTAHIRPRTRFSRNGILICDQHCSPSYSGILQIGLYNAGVNSFLLRKGLKFAQIVFEMLSSVPDSDKLYRNKKNATYNDEAEFRGSRFGIETLSEEGAKLYLDIINSLK